MKKRNRHIPRRGCAGDTGAVARAVHALSLDLAENPGRVAGPRRLLHARSLMPLSTPTAIAVAEEVPDHPLARALVEADHGRFSGIAPHPDLAGLCGHGLNLHDFDLSSIIPTPLGTIAVFEHRFSAPSGHDTAAILLSGNVSEAWLAGGRPAIRLRKGEPLVFDKNRMPGRPFLRPASCRARDRMDATGPLPPVLTDDPHLSPDGRPALAVCFGMHRFEALFRADSITVLRGRGAVASIIEHAALGDLPLSILRESAAINGASGIPGPAGAPVRNTSV